MIASGQPRPPGARALADALDHSAPLALLMQRLHASRERYRDIEALLPAGLRDAVRPGPLDDSQWQLLISDAAAAAKLRQLLPRLQAAMAEKGWQPTPIRLRVQRKT
jgi:hypothetical protein